MGDFLCGCAARKESLSAVTRIGEEHREGAEPGAAGGPLSGAGGGSAAALGREGREGGRGVAACCPERAEGGQAGSWEVAVESSGDWASLLLCTGAVGCGMSSAPIPSFSEQSVSLGCLKYCYFTVFSFKNWSSRFPEASRNFPETKICKRLKVKEEIPFSTVFFSPSTFT